MKKRNLFKQMSLSSGKIIDCHPGQVLFIFYLLSVAIRFLLAFFFRYGPTIWIDESLYINIAKSLAAGEGIAYRSQPVPYLYIFYPLLLAPLYLFPLPFDLYRVVQLYNALLISSSVFPVFLFAKGFTNNQKKALLASGITLLMPDMLMSGFLMSESLVWPLSLWLVFFAWKMYSGTEKHLFYGTLTGIFSALLFWTKPGTIAMGLVFLFAVMMIGEKTEISQRRKSAFLGLAACGGLIVLFYVLYTVVFGYKLSLLGLYQKQLTTVSPKWIAAVAEFSFLQLFLFAVACGGVFFIVPFACAKEYASRQKNFFLAFSVGLIITAVGTAAFVDMFHWNQSFINPQLHLRYMAMFMPVLVVFSLTADWPGDSVRYKALLCLAALAVLILFPGPAVGFLENESTYMDSIALSSWIGPPLVPPQVGTALSFILVLFLSIVFFQICFRKSFYNLKKQCVFFLIPFLLCNNVFGYVACTVHRDDNDFGQDAVEINSLLEESTGNILIITQQDYKDYHSYYLESRLRKPYQQVTIDSFIEALSDTGGIYVPFIPEDQDPNVGNRITPDTDTFLFGATVANQVEFSSSAEIQKSQNEWYALVHVPEGSRIADTMLQGIDTQTLHDNAQAKLYVFDSSRYKNGKLTLHLLAYAEAGPVELEILNAGKTQSFTITENSKQTLVSLREGDTIITAHGGDVLISVYWTD